MKLPSVFFSVFLLVTLSSAAFTSTQAAKVKSLGLFKGGTSKTTAKQSTKMENKGCVSDAQSAPSSFRPKAAPMAPFMFLSPFKLRLPAHS